MIAANWKMNKTITETREFLTPFIALHEDSPEVEVVISPPFTSLSAASALLTDSGIKLAGQNVHWEESGAFTGEISPSMLKDAGCSYVIIGHSERRQYFGETNRNVNRRIKASLSVGIGIILCIGETLDERESGKTFEVLKGQIHGGLDGVAPDRLVIAYEPVWAIGTGKTASPGQAEDAHRFIRDELKELYGGASDTIRILYGGSVKPANIKRLMSEENIDGALVGGASLDPESFANIVKY